MSCCSNEARTHTCTHTHTHTHTHSYTRVSNLKFEVTFSMTNQFGQVSLSHRVCHWHAVPRTCVSVCMFVLGDVKGIRVLFCQLHCYISSHVWGIQMNLGHARSRWYVTSDWEYDMGLAPQSPSQYVRVAAFCCPCPYVGNELQKDSLLSSMQIKNNVFFPWRIFFHLQTTSHTLAVTLSSQTMRRMTYL